MSGKLQIPFVLAGIKTVEFATIKEVYNGDVPVNIESDLTATITPEHHSLIVQCNVLYKSGDVPFIVLKVACAFDIELKAFKEFLVEEQNKYVIPRGFFMHLAVLTVGTARGVLHAKLENTELPHFILPTIDVSQMVKTDMVFDMSLAK